MSSVLFCNRKIIFDHFCYRYFSACMFQNASFVFINTKNCSKIWLCLRNLLDSYAQVYCHLDNDEAGENACVELQKRYGDKVIDHSHLYTGYKDLNEYLMSHKTRK